MGKAGRFACIFTPMALSIASLICIIMMFLAGVGGNLKSNYFMKADLTNFDPNPSIDLDPNSSLDDTVIGALRGGKGGGASAQVENIYQVYMWNYCSGESTSDLDYCSPRKASFWFNPIEVWKLEGTPAQEKFPKKLQDGLNVYRKVAGWMFTAYTVAFFATLAEIVLGIFAIWSRWGSFVTTIASGVSTVFAIGAAATSTALYGSLVGTFNTALKPYNIRGTLGTRALTVAWLAAVFSTAAGLFWLFSVCCCSGKSPHAHGGRKTTVEKTPYTYERVASPFAGHRESEVPLTQMGAPMGNTHHQQNSAYEPFRSRV